MPNIDRLNDSTLHRCSYCSLSGSDVYHFGMCPRIIHEARDRCGNLVSFMVLRYDDVVLTFEAHGLSCSQERP
jgi:hypothetical protein